MTSPAPDAYDHIARLLRVSEHTVKAIQRGESASIAERKQWLLAKALRTAAADRIEDQIDGANITQAVVAFGVATDKAQLLSGDMTARIEHVATQGNIFQQFQRFHDEFLKTMKAKADQPPRPQLVLTDGEAGSDSRG